MLNFKRFWILILLSIFMISGCAAEAVETEPTPSDNNIAALEKVVSPTSDRATATKQARPTSSPLPTATDKIPVAEDDENTVTDTAVVPTSTNTPSVPVKPTQTPIHVTPIPPKTTPVNPGDKVDTFLVRSLNTETDTSFEELAVERSKQHLSQKLQLPIEEITLVSINRAELDNNNICQSPTGTGEGVENHGITLGYEILLSANNETYRYMISHNLGYYCTN